MMTQTVRWREHTVTVREMLVRDREHARRIWRTVTEAQPDADSGLVADYAAAVALIDDGDAGLWTRPAVNADREALLAGYEAWRGLPARFADALTAALYTTDDDSEKN